MKVEKRNYHKEIEKFLAKYPYKTMQIGKANFRYILAGRENAPCIVFLNGGMNCSEMWFKYVESLSKKYRVLIFDYPQKLKNCNETAAGMYRLFMKLGIKKAFFAGASFGGIMAQLFARKYPQTVTGLGLFSTGGLDDCTIKGARIKYLFLPLMIWYIRHSNYEKLKPKMIENCLRKFVKNETARDKRYV